MPLQLQWRQRGVCSNLVHGTGGTSAAALKAAQINCVEDWTLVCFVLEVSTWHWISSRLCFSLKKCIFSPQLFSFYLLYYNWPSWQISHQIVTTCSLSTARLIPPKKRCKCKWKKETVPENFIRMGNKLFVRVGSLLMGLDGDVQTGGVGSPVTNPDTLSSLMRSESAPDFLIRTSDTDGSLWMLKTRREHLKKESLQRPEDSVFCQNVQ